MRCPECGGNTTVLETRTLFSEEIRRRRICRDCGYRFTTIETIWRKQEDKPEQLKEGGKDENA